MTIPRMSNSAEPTSAASKDTLTITDFVSGNRDLGWYVQNDNVMGGRSEGDFDTSKQGELIFAGSTNTNGGGFSSIRTSPFKADLANYDGIQIRVLGDGRRYIWQLQTTALYRRYRISYWAEFDTTAGEWSTVNIPFSDFYPQVRGYKLDGPALDTRDITELGLYIYDKKDGAFKLQLDSIKAYSGKLP